MSSLERPTPEWVKFAAVIAVGNTGAVGIAALIFLPAPQNVVTFLIAVAVAGLIGWLVVSKLSTDRTTARIAAVVIAIASMIDWFLGILSQTYMATFYGMFILSQEGSAACLLFAVAWGLPAPASSQVVTESVEKPSVAAPLRDANDSVEQLRKLGELRTAGVLTEEEFAAKKAELLKRI
jgi:hypothetical protein